ncbi:MAG: sigma-70 family RNA polymerase sigma factor [Clostridia bacterium]|nr:sigma-70 family RNA polymerase sigma factor [Clostridia bacterium]
MIIQSLRTDDCFEETVEKYSNLIYRIAYMNVRIKSDADDVFQEVWCRYYQKNINFESEEHRRNWLINVTLKCCKKIYSSSWYKKTVFFDDFPCLKEELSEKDYDVYYAVMNLPAKYRIPIYLFYYENFSVEEISQTTNINPSTVRSQLKRGREKLKHSLKGAELNESKKF